MFMFTAERYQTPFSRLANSVGRYGSNSNSALGMPLSSLYRSKLSFPQPDAEFHSLKGAIKH
ncbi:hypothetical protein ACTXT7_002631 [Hymenolepis weldensis]